MTTLVAIGCSHTSGSMMDGKNGSSEYNVANTFAGVLAKKHNMKYHNLGLPGGSNAYIYRSTIKFINEQMKADEDYIFLIGWTSTARMELRYPNDTTPEYNTMAEFVDNKYMPFSVGIQKSLMLTREAKELVDNIELIVDYDILAYNWATYALVLQKLFEHKKIKYLMFNTCYDLPVHASNLKIIEKIDQTTYIDPLLLNKSFLYWALERGFKKTECWHLREDAHRTWASFLEKRLMILGHL
jgi:hypothetical protein